MQPICIGVDEKGELVWGTAPKPRYRIFNYDGYFRAHWMWLVLAENGELPFFEDFGHE